MKEKIIKGFRKVTNKKHKKPTCESSASTPKPLEKEILDFVEESFSDSVTEYSKSEATMAEFQNECFDDGVKRFQSGAIDIAPLVDYDYRLESPPQHAHLIAPLKTTYYSWAPITASDVADNKNNMVNNTLGRTENEEINIYQSIIDVEDMHRTRQWDNHIHMKSFVNNFQSGESFDWNKSSGPNIVDHSNVENHLPITSGKNYYKPVQSVKNTTMIPTSNEDTRSLFEVNKALADDIFNLGDSSSYSDHSY